MKRHPRSHVIVLLCGAANSSFGLYLALRFLIGSRWWWLGLLHTFAFWLFLPLLGVGMLAWLARGKRTALISMLLFLFGMSRFAPLPLGMVTASDSPHDLRVMTFNVWIRNQELERSIDWILAQDADVLILQEFAMHHEVSLPRLLQHYPHHAYVDGNVRILSRYPLLENNLVLLAEPMGWRDARLAVRAVVDVNGRAVTVYGVHLSVPLRRESRINTGIMPIDDLFKYDETFRNIQIRALAELVSAESNPVIVAGDFNTSHTSPQLEALSNIGLTDAFRAVGTGWGMTWMMEPPQMPLIRIDYVWSSQHLTPLRYQRGTFVGSDHLPVVVDYAFAE